MTASRLYNEFGVKSHKTARKPRLTMAMKFKRLNFAKNMKVGQLNSAEKSYSRMNR